MDCKDCRGVVSTGKAVGGPGMEELGAFEDLPKESIVIVGRFERDEGGIG